MAVQDTALSTLANIKEHLSVSGSGDDTKLEAFIDIVTDLLEDETARNLKGRNYNGFGTNFDHGSSETVASEDYLYFDGQDIVQDNNGYNVLYLEQWPVLRTSDSANALTFALAVLSDRTSGGDTWDTSSFTEGDDYVVDYKNGIVRFMGAKPLGGLKKFRVTCTAGYTGSSAPFVPSTLEYIVKELVGDIYNNKENIKSEKIGTWSREYFSTDGQDGNKSKLTNVERLISKFKNIRL